MANRLANETSPYLLQHKDNPVDWYPWGEEAFAKARAEDKPVFLSIGYSSCHWCHVMERESFEDEETAALLNENFVSIKVDREERPDIDSIFMTAVQGMTGQGGWPLSAFLTVDGAPFYTGTYYPPERREGTPSFRDILGLVIKAYREHRDDLTEAGRQVAAYLKGQTRVLVSAEPLSNQVMHQAYRALASNFDAEHGGFGRAPKFPQPTLDEFLFRYWHATGEARAIAMVEITLNRMARGGLRDQIGGGFHRYSTDTSWLVPHFEKMLYGNALLAGAYLHLWQATGKDFSRHVVEDTLAYVEREMLDPSGAFYSAQDADSEGEEGKFFVWRATEVDRLLGPELSRVGRLYYGITDGGNFHGRNVLSTPLDDEEAAHLLQMSVADLHAAAAEVRARLWAEREKRVAPARDEKAVTAWNALMLKAFAEAGAALADERYIDIARRNAEFILTSLTRDGRLLRTWRATPEGGSAKLGGYLEDYAFFVEALLSLYEATFEPRWLIEATQLAHTMLDLFWDGDTEAFFDTARDHEQLVVRPRNVFDNAYPSGGSAATLALLRLAVFTGDEDLERYAVRSLYSVRGLMGTASAAVSNWLAALDFHLSARQEIVVVGPREDPRTKALLGVCYDRYLPNKVVAGAEERQETPISPLLADRGLVDGLPTAYLCENYRCDLPVTEPMGLATLLSGRRAPS